QAGLLRLGQVEVADLAGGVDPGVRSPGDHEPRIAAQDPADRPLERALHGAQPGLSRPAPESGAVVRQVESDPHGFSLSAARASSSGRAARRLALAYSAASSSARVGGLAPPRETVIPAASAALRIARSTAVSEVNSSGSSSAPAISAAM